MEKKYDKPQVFFEDFQLSANIAGDCTGRPNNQSDEGSCGYEDNGFVIFVEGNSGCAFKTKGPFNRVCYHVPTGDISVFVS